MKKKNNGIAVVGKEGKFGYIRHNGEEITPLKYDKVKRFYWDIGRVSIDGKWGIVDKSGKEITPLIYDEIKGLQDPIVKLNGKYGFINRKTGELLTPVKYDEASEWVQMLNFSDDDFHKNDLAAVQLGGKWGCIDVHGNEIVPLKYDEIRIHQSGDLPVSARLKRKWGFIDSAGKEITPFEYSRVYPFSAGRALVKKKGKYGFIDNKGVLVIPAVYDDCESYFNKEYDKDYSPIVVKLDGKYGYIDVNGNEIVKPIYEYATSFYYSKGMVAVMLNGKVGFIDETGKEKIPFIYEPVGNPYKRNNWIYHYQFMDNFANVKLNGKCGVIDRKNKVVIPFIYDKFLKNMDAGWRCVMRDGKKLSIDTKGVERSMQKNPNARTFKDYLHAVTSSEVVESGRTLLGLYKKEMNILEINFDNFSGKSPRSSHDIIRIHIDYYGKKGRKRMPITVSNYSVKNKCVYGYPKWDEALDMEVRIEDDLILSDAETVAVCIWGACDQWLGTEETIQTYFDVLHYIVETSEENDGHK